MAKSLSLGPKSALRFRGGFTYRIALMLMVPTAIEAFFLAPTMVSKTQDLLTSQEGHIIVQSVATSPGRRTVVLLNELP